MPILGRLPDMLLLLAVEVFPWKEDHRRKRFDFTNLYNICLAILIPPNEYNKRMEGLKVKVMTDNKIATKRRKKKQNSES